VSLFERQLDGAVPSTEVSRMGSSRRGGSAAEDGEKDGRAGDESFGRADGGGNPQREVEE
jgi:hypothetical protein